MPFGNSSDIYDLTIGILTTRYRVVGGGVAAAVRLAHVGGRQITIGDTLEPSLTRAVNIKGDCTQAPAVTRGADL